jgi:N-methylhydantoinase A
MSTVIGVDVGGTFTDFFILDTKSGAASVFKTSSTPANPALAIAEGLRAILESGLADAKAISRISHGTTVGTNALIERKGAEVTLIVTRGFRDLLEIGRQTRPHLYSLQIDAPEPLVPRSRRLEVTERMLADGSVKVPLEASEIERVVAEARASGSRAIAICLLFSFLNPAHERELDKALAAAGCRLVSASSEVQPEFREFERMSTTVLNAYLQPLMVNYLQSLADGVRQIAPAATLSINQSSGGLMSAARAARLPVRTALSGPAAGAVGAAYIARSARRPNVLTLDMGGTSADVCLIRDAKCGISYEGSVGGFPVRLPMVDVNAVGAGGGSIAWMDRDGLLKVGPASAGASPGPACYCLGGEAPTVTDANLLLGRLSPAGLLSGRLKLDAGRSQVAFDGLAAKLGITAERAALGCIEVVVSNMVRAIRSVSVERGHDPQEFALLAFGGGGPLHARAVAASLRIKEFLVPPHPGILCAQGLLAAEISENFVATRRTVVSAEAHRVILDALEALSAQADDWYASESASPDNRRSDFTLDMRYVGQNYELSVPFDLSRLLLATPAESATLMRENFSRAHEKFYGTVNEGAAIEVVNVRLMARITAVPLSDPPQRPPVSAPVKPRSRRPVHFGAAGWVDCPIYDRTELLPGASLIGPAIVEQLDTTTLVFPEDRLHVDGAANLLVTVRS